MNSSLQATGLVWPGAGDWRLALRVVLIVFTVLVALALAGSFVPYEQVIAKGHPWLPSFHCPGCLFCGMTRSFCALSSGHWQEAWQWNHGGPFLYIGGWLWLLCAGITLVRGDKRKRSEAARASAKGLETLK